MKKIIKSNKDYLKKILDESPNGRQTFRYFEKRSFDVINNHIISLIVLENEVPAAYFHLEEELDKTWFGIIVSDIFIGKKLGNYCLDIAIKISDILDIKNIYLSVDKTNYKAISLYEKFNFKIEEEKEKNFIMMRG